MKTPLKDIVTQAHDNVASGDTLLLGTSSDKSSDIIVVQDKNGHIYTDEYMFRLINCLAKCRLSVNQLINCSPEFQKVFFGQDHLSTPCHATISRAVDSVSITLKQLLLEELNNNENGIIRAFDESAGHIAIFYWYCNFLSDQQLQEKRQLLAKLPVLKTKRLERHRLETEILLRCEQKFCCLSVEKMDNLTHEQILERISEQEQELTNKPSANVIDHGSSCKKAVEEMKIYIINCIGHVLNLVSEHFTDDLYENTTSKVAKVIRKLRTAWKFLSPVIRAELSVENFIESILDHEDAEIVFPKELKIPKLLVPPEPCITRWQTVARAASFIFKYLAFILKAIEYWKSVETRDKNVQATWDEILVILKDEEFQNAVEYIHALYENFIDPCFEELRTNNRFGWLFQYYTEWRKRLENFTLTDTPSKQFKEARKAALKEFDKLMEHHTKSYRMYLASLVNKKYAPLALNTLWNKKFRNFLDFDVDKLKLIKQGTNTIFDFPEELKKWVKHFGSAVIDNEIVESCFSLLDNGSMANRDHIGHMLRLFTNKIDWKGQLLTRLNERYHANAIERNNKGRHKRNESEVLIQTLKRVRVEKLRRVPQSNHVPLFMDYVLYLFQVLSNFEVYGIEWTPSGLSVKILESALAALVTFQAISVEDAICEEKTTKHLLEVFERDIVKDGLMDDYFLLVF